MELSRLSNSLGSVCSQRRGRLAAVAGRPRLPRSLSHRSPPLPSLRSHWSIFVPPPRQCFCLAAPTTSLLQLTHEAVSLARPPNAAPGLCDIGPIAVRVLKLTAAQHTMVLSLGGTLARGHFLPSPLSSTSSTPHPPTPQPEAQERLWHDAY